MWNIKRMKFTFFFKLTPRCAIIYFKSHSLSPSLPSKGKFHVKLESFAKSFVEIAASLLHIWFWDMPQSTLFSSSPIIFQNLTLHTVFSKNENVTLPKFRGMGKLAKRDRHQKEKLPNALYLIFTILVSFSPDKCTVCLKGQKSTLFEIFSNGAVP